MIHIMFLLSIGFIVGAIVGECGHNNDNWFPAFLMAIGVIVFTISTIFLVAKGW